MQQAGRGTARRRVQEGPGRAERGASGQPIAGPSPDDPASIFRFWDLTNPRLWDATQPKPRDFQVEEVKGHEDLGLMCLVPCLASRPLSKIAHLG